MDEKADQRRAVRDQVADRMQHSDGRIDPAVARVRDGLNPPADEPAEDEPTEDDSAVSRREAG